MNLFILSKVRLYLVGFILVSMCSVSFGKDSADKFIGQYQYVNLAKGGNEVLEIVRKGDSYFLFDAQKNIFLLDKTAEGLALQGNNFSLSEDGEILKFTETDYPRISYEPSGSFMGNLHKDKPVCRELDEEAAFKRIELPDAADWIAYVDELQKRIPSGCILVNDGIPLGFNAPGPIKY